MTLSDLERLAREAPQGEYFCDDRGWVVAIPDPNRPGEEIEILVFGGEDNEGRAARLAAALDPTTVLALLRVVRAAQGLYARDVGEYVAVTPSTMAELSNALAALNLKDET